MFLCQAAKIKIKVQSNQSLDAVTFSIQSKITGPHLLQYMYTNEVPRPTKYMFMFMFEVRQVFSM